jgi:HEPN domain-containing protein
MKFLSSEWLKAAGDDLLAIEMVSRNSGLTHISAFHAQQSVEKCLKAVLEEKSIEVPKIHSLVRLSELVSGVIGLELNKDTLKTLDELYIEARYPGELGLLPNGKPTMDEA